MEQSLTAEDGFSVVTDGWLWRVQKMHHPPVIGIPNEHG